MPIACFFHIFRFQNRLKNTKNPRPIKAWDTGTGGGVAGSRTRVRRSSPNSAYSLGVIMIWPCSDHVAKAAGRG